MILPDFSGFLPHFKLSVKSILKYFLNKVSQFFDNVQATVLQEKTQKCPINLASQPTSISLEYVNPISFKATKQEMCRTFWPDVHAPNSLAHSHLHSVPIEYFYFTLMYSLID